ncbi:hypothetical protein Hanom_Chr16g01489161 [Helianthus anomalus]
MSGTQVDYGSTRSGGEPAHLQNCKTSIETGILELVTQSLQLHNPV